MNVSVERITEWAVARDCARNTVWKTPIAFSEPSADFKRMLVRSEHSPLRCVIYKISMMEIPSFVSVHFVRHKFGVEHFVSSNRPDRNGGNYDIDRYSPVNHIMIVNAQELLHMSRKRLCSMASKETREVMEMIKEAMYSIDPIVAMRMVPQCLHLGFCPEPCGCGYCATKEFYDKRGSLM